MTTTVTVSVNGNYKVPIHCRGENGESTVILSGRGQPGPNIQVFNMPHGSNAVISVGPEEPDNTPAEGEAA